MPLCKESVVAATPPVYYIYSYLIASLLGGIYNGSNRNIFHPEESQTKRQHIKARKLEKNQ